MGLANKSVVLYQSIKIGKKWTFRPVDEDSSHFSEGPFYVSWYDCKKKQMDPVGRDPELALSKAKLKRAALAYISAGGEIKNTNQPQNPVGDLTEAEVKNTNPAQDPAQDRISVTTAISEYVADCLDRQGKSGYSPTLTRRSHPGTEAHRSVAGPHLA
jgi:hypothetical protein